MSAQIVLRLVLWPWVAATAYLGHTMLLARVPAVTLPALVLLLATTAFQLYLRLPTLRGWLDGIEIRRLLFFHLTRFGAVVFLVLHHRGELPYRFAIPVGIGEIALATFAVPVGFAPLSDNARRRALSIWNIAGLSHLVFVFATITHDPAAMHALATLPLVFWPVFLVPLYLVTHAIVLVRLTRPNDSREP